MSAQCTSDSKLLCQLGAQMQADCMVHCEQVMVQKELVEALFDLCMCWGRWAGHTGGQQDRVWAAAAGFLAGR